MKKNNRDRKGQDSFENATNLSRVPTSEEIMNLGEQPHIPTRGLSSIITHIPDQDKTFKLGIDELSKNKYKKDKADWGIHHRYY